jgi:predicted RNase H-like HicB family nuclease
VEERVRSDSYIGLFRAFPRGDWRVTFPDLPGCEARGRSFKEVFHAAQDALAEHLELMDEPAPRPRSTAELLIDAQRDWVLCREFVDAVMHPVRPAHAEERAPLELVAMRAGGGERSTPQIGA